MNNNTNDSNFPVAQIETDARREEAVLSYWGSKGVRWAQHGRMVGGRFIATGELHRVCEQAGLIDKLRNK